MEESVKLAPELHSLNGRPYNMQKVILGFLFLLMVALIGGGIWYYAQLPKNAQEQYARAQEIEQKSSAAILEEKATGTPDQAEIDKLEAKIDAAYQEVIDKYPESTEAEESEFKLIELARGRGDLKGRDLIAKYEEYMEKYPESEKGPDLVLRIAKIYSDDLKLDGEAIKIYQEFVDKFPDDERVPEALFEIAKIQEKIKEFEAAEETYTRIIEDFPESELAAEAQYRRGNLRADELDKKKEAAEDFKDVAEKHPDSKQARVAQARQREVARAATQESADQAQEEYYGTQEIVPYQMPLSDFNDPTVTVIREQEVDSLDYDIALTLDPATSGLKAQVEYVVRPKSKPLSDQFIMQFNGTCNIAKIEQDGEELQFEQKGNFLYMALVDTMVPGESYTFSFEYEGTADETWKGDVITEDGTYLRPESRWYPYTSWGDEFTAAIDVEVPQGITGVAPGLLVDTSKTSDTVTFSWKSEEPISILAVVANEYEKKEREIDGGRLLLETYVYPEHEEFGELYLDEMEKILAYYESLFGEFPYKKMAVAEIPFFPGGYGSPTLLMITELVFNEKKKVVAEFLAHEIVHQWFGNLLSLTLEEESHPWLSEGFATYIDALYIEHAKGESAFRARVLSMANLYRESTLAFEEVPMLECLWDNPMYRTLVYEKGGLILHTLRYIMGDEAFFAGLRDFVQTFAHRNITVSDFMTTMEAHHGESLAFWREQWIDGVGYPYYYVADAEAEQQLVPGGGAEEREWQLNVTLQMLDEQVFAGPVEVQIIGEDDEEQFERVWLEDREREVTFTVPFPPARVVIDPNAYYLKHPSIEDLEEDVTLIETD